ncbi:MAG: SDR family oxidoreductase [Acidobacteriota bacterium]|jgi:thioester reductase-like protein|nr:SDR family oxidoreductase [Acidobacteriota bacterium]MDQ3372419.1 SDR family oxidoreductase [Acidobacteriota bacterium]
MNFDETIFLTGFPGFIAQRLVKRLAKPGTQFFLLVQASFVEKAIQDVEKIAEETNTPLENFALVEGDITQKNLGISETDLEIIRADATDVYHLAAVYDLAVKEDLAYDVNVKGTININDFVKSMPNLRRYNYVSTCYVSGLRKGLIYESELEHGTGFRNFYEKSKYFAELEVEKLKKENIPLTIYRPSVVVGDSKTGETAKYDGVYYLIRYLRKLPSLLRFVNVGNKKVELNLVPVDFVVESIAALAKDEKAVGKTVALADPHPLTTEELFDTISEALTNRKSVIKPPPILIEKTLMLPFSPLVSGLPHSGVSYFFVPQVYDTSAANKLLAPHNIGCPNFKSYIENLLEFVKKNPNL